MNSTSREIRRLNIESFFNRRGLWRCYRCCWRCFLLFGQRASACTFDHLFVRLPSLCFRVCLSFVICLKISLPFIQLLLFEQDTSVFLFKLPFKFRNVLQHIEAGVEAPLLVIKISNKTSPELEVFLNETKQKLILHENIHETREQYPRKNWVQWLKIT